MTARILDGTATAAAIKTDLTGRVAALRDRGIVPGLATVLVGTDPGSQWYVGGSMITLFHRMFLMLRLPN